MIDNSSSAPDLDAIVDQLQSLYETSVANLREGLSAYLTKGERPDLEARFDGAFAYPELRIHYAPEGPSPRVGRAFGIIREAGAYAATLTRPALFRAYILEQLELLIRDYGVTVEVGLSAQEIPYPFVLDGAEDLQLDGAQSEDLARWFPTTQLAHIGDEIADGVFEPLLDEARPLSLFDALRVDFSLARIKHYTGTPVEHVQHYVLFTNYTRYVDEFTRYALDQIGQGHYTALSAPGVLITAETPDAAQALEQSNWRAKQMPAYHLMTEDGRGITLVNIGVGPSNAKNICDHLAVLRPQAWLMIGHCGGLRPSQTIGDYVLAHAYLRDDHVLDDVLPTEIPIPPIAEVQQALYRAAEIVSGETGEVLKRRLRTGTVVTTDDRNWELRYTSSALRFNQSRAVAIDMESATIAAQGYRFRVPYGTLLCVSDKPLHGEIKLPGQANTFYERAISQHLRIGIAAVEELRQQGSRLHSRKLRAFDEPPFR
ncbi:MAG: AMP nucleosidase [Pseudomonadota bacterium]|nr:AMP nucleosidase [Pseudomonadota bacterium]